MAWFGIKYAKPVECENDMVDLNKWIKDKSEDYDSLGKNLSDKKMNLKSKKEQILHEKSELKGMLDNYFIKKK